ncbi:hypothetical protein CKW39_10635 [Kocuria sp. WRN011]|uniref:hypothetical protein n=1 Tax=Kocuria sp. WRN011 TaxID=2029858 RepID=UPI000BAEC76F|nr:hypothetical protein [Kocuria sp. WRN011]PBB08251.1 hypothetical protein CKW39_10635 [Kocuria sp. WRN011]
MPTRTRRELDEIQEIVERYLTMVARHCGDTDYTEVCREVSRHPKYKGFTTRDADDRRELRGILGRISEGTYKKYGVLLTAIVWQRWGGVRIKSVGDGFWTMAVGCGRLTEEPEDDQKEEVLQALVDEVHVAYARRVLSN